MNSPDELEVWPASQQIIAAGDAKIGLTHFADSESYHPMLRDTLLRLHRTSSQTDHLVRGNCGVKVRHIEKWLCPAAKLINHRAIALFKNTLKTNEAYIDDSWGNIYRDRDYCAIHSHIRSNAAVVYLLDSGDEDKKDMGMGKFFIADPRVAFCCPHHPGHMTRLLIPDMRPGSMLIFPGQVMHGVNPYYGARPRLTLSWNITLQPVAGTARETFEGKK